MELNFAEIENNAHSSYQNYDYDYNSYENFDYNSEEIQNIEPRNIEPRNIEPRNIEPRNTEPRNIEPRKYWEKNLDENKIAQPKKKKVTFTDILNNMNLVVNNQGVLQFMAPVNAGNEEVQQQSYMPHTERKIEPLDPSVKHSYIYNKYFKDYKDVNAPKPVKVARTREEYIQMVVEERIRQVEEKKRIAQIKSKKLIFTTNYSTPGSIKPSKNNLRRMSFQ